MGAARYEITDPFDAQSVFEFVQQEGNVDDEEMHRTFNMGTGFVATMPAEDAESVVESGDDARIIGAVKEADSEEGLVVIRGIEL
jgi:phosphoribosylformylglycinamidine cyclo-ligase